MTSASLPVQQADVKAYWQRIRAWTMYDWANSAFATTILAAVLPVYYSQVAGATLPSDAVATAYWSLGLSLSLLISALLSPVLGTLSDITRSKKRLLFIFTALGVLGTASLMIVGYGDWLLASVIFIIARVGFIGAITFYDSLLPHVAKPEDQDSVSARGYAMGYLGGGILLAINIVMIFMNPEQGTQLSFLSVAIWWAVFSIPLFRLVPEPPSATAGVTKGFAVVSASFARLRDTIRDISHYRELFKYLVAFLIYNDAIGTIIALATIYGAELGFNTIELILALLLVQFVGIPFSLIFGRLPNPAETRRPMFLAYIVFNLIALPIVGVVGRQLVPLDVSGAPQPAYAFVNGATVDEEVFLSDHPALVYSGDWTAETLPVAVTGLETDQRYVSSDTVNDELNFTFYGQKVELLTSTGPDHGIWAVNLDGDPVLDDGEPVVIDAYSATPRYGVEQTFNALEPGEHVLTLTNTGERNAASSGNRISVNQIVLPDVRQTSLPLVIGMIVVIQLIGALFAWLFGRQLFTRLAEQLDTRRSILLALVIYSTIALWAFVLDSSIEFWFLAWLVAIVQGGSQALSRSLYTRMSPAAKSGEFFGLYGIMEKFSSILGPLVFALAVATFGSSRPAILSLILFFIVGGYLLTRVDIAEGERVAREEDAALIGQG